MAEKKVTPVAKKVAVTKPKATTGSVAAAKTKAAVAIQPAAKKVVAKKAEAAVAETPKAKPSAVKKVSATAAAASAPANKAATTRVKPAAVANKEAVRLTPEERYRMVQTAAYFMAERHGFQGRCDEHWVAAEREIAAKLGWL